MASTSKWPLPQRGVRFITPGFMVAKLDKNPLTRDCYPTALGYYPRAAGHRMARRHADDNLLLYCTEGQGHIELDGQAFGVTAGDLVLLPQGLPHAYGADQRAPWSLYWSHFQGASSAVFINYLGFRPTAPVQRVGLSPSLLGGFDSLLQVRRTGYSSAAFINASNQLRHLLTQFGLEAGQRDREHRLDLAAVQAYMQDNIHRSLDLETLAAVASLSKFYFATKYKALTGYPPIRHFLHMKMEYACQLLDSTEQSVQAIAQALGYSDPLYFSRLFRNTVGRSPRAYRASLRQ